MRTLAPVFAFLLLARAALAAPTLEAPPGWKDMPADKRGRNTVIGLKGPETSSFIVKAAPALPLDNPAGVRGYLNDVLTGLRQASRRDYRSSGRVETVTFRNALTAQLLRAQLNGEDRLVLAAFGSGGVAYVAVLVSAAPEAMLPSLLGAVETDGVEGEVKISGNARSLDGQLELSLGGGLRSRALLPGERLKGFELVVQGSGAEVVFQKLAETESTKPLEQAAIVRELAAASAGVDSGKASAVLPAPTAAGPIGVYSWVPLANGDRMAAGYLPWSFWGYQLFARGPGADELLVGTLAALRAGPRAVPGLLSSTPVIPIKKAWPVRPVVLGGAALVFLLSVTGLIAWSRRRKNANLPS